MRRILPIIFFGILMSASQSFGVSFSDSQWYWPGWSNGQSSDEKDRIGVPDLTGGSVTIDPAGNLTEINFSYIEYSDSLLGPGDVFIDVGSDKTWDYVIKTMGIKTAGNYDVYKFSPGLSEIRGVNDNYYQMSGQDNVGSWIGYDIRDNHPIGIVLGNIPSNIKYSWGTVYFSGWPDSGTSTYNNFSNGIYIGAQDFTLAWEVTCANDVLYEKIDNHAPEPATMFLLGAGLIGLGTYGRKRLTKKIA